MIDARELRIGNIVEPITMSPIMVTGITQQKTLDGIFTLIFVDYGESFLQEHLNPVELSEEWLIKLGFEYAMFHASDDDGVVMDKMEANEDYFKHPNLPEKFIFYLPYFNMSIYVGSVTIQHVNQLQNLYFALTGKELTIQP